MALLPHRYSNFSGMISGFYRYVGFPVPIPRYTGFPGPVSPWVTLGFPGPQSNNNLDFRFSWPDSSDLGASTLLAPGFSWPGS